MMKRIPILTFFVIPLIAASALGQGDKLLFSEAVVTPTAGEMVEIYNPTMAAIDLTDYYITDATFAGGGVFYYNIVTGVDAGGGGFGDWHARFPAAAMIGPGEVQTIALNGSMGFSSAYGVDPTYEIFEDGAMPDGIPDMLEAFPDSIDATPGGAGLTNSGEVAILYHWDGMSDLIQDLDYIIWGDKDEAVDKTGVMIDGPDGDMDTSSYLADTAIIDIVDQDVIAGSGHAGGASFNRIDFTEGTQTTMGGNGLMGSDETSENLSVTWSADMAATPGFLVPEPTSAYFMMFALMALSHLVIRKR